MENTKRFEVTSMHLHIIAMIFMLFDHLWATVIQDNDWLNCIGRIAFPIFAFMIVEGYFYTKDLRNYVKRLFLFAIISEVPFDMMISGSYFYPFHQNVIWTFIIGILLVHFNEKARKINKFWIRIIVAISTIILGSILGVITMVDYYNAGVLTVLVFYFFRRKKWWNYIAQFILLAYINVEILSGFSYEINIFGNTYYLARQAFALLALIPIWLYKGKQGYHSKKLQAIYYGFYPVHLLILGCIRMLLTGMI